MKFRETATYCFLLLSIFVLPSPGAAASAPSSTDVGSPLIRFYTGIGVTVPTSQDLTSGMLHRRYDPGTAYRIGAALRLSSRLLVGPEFEYHSFSGVGSTSTLKRKIYVLGATLRYSRRIRMPAARAASAGERSTAYLLLTGFGSARVDDLEGNTDYGTAWIGGGVIHHFSSRIAVLADIRWEYVFERKINYIPFTIGLAF